VHKSTNFLSQSFFNLLIFVNKACFKLNINAMRTTSQSRRQFVKNSVAGAGLLFLPNLLSAQSSELLKRKK